MLFTNNNNGIALSGAAANLIITPKNGGGSGAGISVNNNPGVFDSNIKEGNSSSLANIASQFSSNNSYFTEGTLKSSGNNSASKVANNN